jgi:hypothetical protein
VLDIEQKKEYTDIKQIGQNWVFLRSPRNSLTCLAAQSLRSAHRATRFLKLQPYKIKVVQRLTNPDSCARICFCNWLLLSMHDANVNPEVLLASDEAWLYLSGYVNTQNYHYQSSENSTSVACNTLFMKLRFQSGVQVTSKRIIGPFFLNYTLNSECHVHMMNRPFHQDLTNEENTFTACKTAYSSHSYWLLLALTLGA